MGKVDGRRATRRICCKGLLGRNRKLPVGGHGPVEVAEIRMGRFGSRPFGNLEKTCSGWPRENRFSASLLIQFIRSASFGIAAVGMSDGYGDRKVYYDLVGLAINPQRVYRHFGNKPA